MRLNEFSTPAAGSYTPPGLLTAGKIRKGFPSTGSPEVDDSLDGTDIKKARKKYVDDKKSTL